MRYYIVPYDDGVLLYGAERVLAGDIPYRDFYFIYTPGNIYLLAFIFKIFGPSIIIQRILNSIICFFILVTTYLMARKIIKSFYAQLIVIFLTLFCIWFFGSYANQNMSILFSLLSGIYFINYLKKEIKSYLIISGLFIGLAGIFRCDFALYTFLAATITLIIFEFKKRSGTCLNKIKRIIYSLKIWLILLGSGLIILIPMIIYLIIMVPLPDLINQFILYPTKLYPITHSFPYPDPSSIYSLITMYFPPFILFLTAIWIIFKIKNRVITIKEWVIIYLLLLGLIAMNSVRIMPMSLHIHLTMISTIILFAFLMTKYVRLDKNIFKINESIQIIKLFFTFFSIFIILCCSFYLIASIHQASANVPLETSRGVGIYVSPEQTNLNVVADYIKENVPPTEKILVCGYYHDKIIENPEIVYFLSDRQSATKYSDMIQGVVTNQDIQEEIIGEIKNNNVNYVILYEYKTPVNGIGSTKLINYIKDNFKPIKVVDQYTIYKRTG